MVLYFPDAATWRLDVMKSPERESVGERERNRELRHLGSEGRCSVGPGLIWVTRMAQNLALLLAYVI